jgi:hypothetical protein
MSEAQAAILEIQGVEDIDLIQFATQRYKCVISPDDAAAVDVR